MADAGVKNLHGVLRAALAQAVRWGWVSTNVASLARLRSTKTQQRDVMTVEDVRAVMTAAATIDPAAALAFRIAAVAGARRAELASLRWTDVRDGQLLDRLGDRDHPARRRHASAARRSDEDGQRSRSSRSTPRRWR